MGTDANPVTLETHLNWDNVTSGNAEFAVSLSDSQNGVISFSSPTHGRVVLRDFPAELRPVLERGRWVSLTDYQNYVIREKEGGSPVALALSGSASVLNGVLSRADVLGMSVAFEPRCDWMSNVCGTGNTRGAISLYDIVYSDSAGHRVASDMRTTVKVNERVFDAWVAVDPKCAAYPYATATFLARE